MGSMQDLMGMIPGVGNALKNVEVGDDTLKPIEAIINSMTPEERRKPELLNGNRRRRIATGSGTTVRDVNELMKQFEQMKKMMKTMQKMGGMGRAMHGLKNMVATKRR